MNTDKAYLLGLVIGGGVFGNGERNRQIMKRRLIDGICIEPLAEEFEMSVRQINDIIRACEARISPHI